MLPTDLKYFYRIQRELYILPLVSVVVYWDQQDQEPTAWLQHLISITAYTNYEVILLHETGCMNDALQAYVMASDQPIKLVKVDGQLGLATVYNQALLHCDGDYIALVSSDIEMRDDTWLSAMLEYCQVPDTGAVCGHLRCTNSRLVALSPLPDILDLSAWYYARYLQQASTLLSGLQCPQNIWSITWECCVLKKEALDQCGGFAADDFPDLFAIHDLSCQFLERGLQLYYTPYCQVDWRSDARRFMQKNGQDSWAAEKLRFQKKWWQTLQHGDPFFNRGKLQEGRITLEDFQNWFVGGVQG